MTSLVFGGPLEQIQLKGTSAYVLFLHASDCEKYFEATANGIEFMHKGKEWVAWVQKAKDVDVIGGQLGLFIKHGFTRCVKANGVDKNLSAEKLGEKAAFRNREVEGIEDRTSESTGVSWTESLLLCLLLCNANYFRFALLSSAFVTSDTLSLLSLLLAVRRNGNTATFTSATIRMPNIQYWQS